MVEKALYIQAQTQVCAHCGKPSAFFCTCSGIKTSWCRDHAFIHLLEKPIVHPMEQDNPEVALFLLEQYQKKVSADPQGKQELWANLARLKECKANFSGKIDGLIASLTKYKTEVLEQLKIKKQELKAKIEAAIHEVETLLDQCGTGLSPLAAALLNYEPGKLQLFQYDDYQLEELSSQINNWPVYRLTNPALLQTNVEVPTGENSPAAMEEQGKSGFQGVESELPAQSQEHVESETHREEQSRAGIQTVPSTGQYTPKKVSNSSQDDWDQLRGLDHSGRTPNELRSFFTRGPQEEEVKEEHLHRRKPSNSMNALNFSFRPTVLKEDITEGAQVRNELNCRISGHFPSPEVQSIGQELQLKSSNSYQEDRDQSSGLDQSGRILTEPEFYLSLSQSKEEVKEEPQYRKRSGSMSERSFIKRMTWEEHAKKEAQLSTESDRRGSQFFFYQEVESTGQDMPQKLSNSPQEDRDQPRRRSFLCSRTPSESLFMPRIQEEDIMEAAGICQPKAKTVGLSTISESQKTKCPCCHRFQSEFDNKGQCVGHGLVCLLCLESNFGSKKCPVKGCRTEYSPKEIDRILRLIEKSKSKKS